MPASAMPTTRTNANTALIFQPSCCWGPTAVWRGWPGDCSNAMRAPHQDNGWAPPVQRYDLRAISSRDNLRTWSRFRRHIRPCSTREGRKSERSASPSPRRQRTVPEIDGNAAGFILQNGHVALHTKPPCPDLYATDCVGGIRRNFSGCQAFRGFSASFERSVGQSPSRRCASARTQRKGRSFLRSAALPSAWKVELLAADAVGSHACFSIAHFLVDRDCEVGNSRANVVENQKAEADDGGGQNHPVNGHSCQLRLSGRRKTWSSFIPLPKLHTVC